MIIKNSTFLKTNSYKLFSVNSLALTKLISARFLLYSPLIIYPLMEDIRKQSSEVCIRLVNHFMGTFANTTM